LNLFLDATSITAFLRCKEEFRQTYLVGRASRYIAIHRSSGIAVHRGIESLWRGKTFTEAQHVMMDYFLKIDESRILPTDLKKWGELKEMAPEQLAVYADGTEIIPGCALEHEWTWKEPFGIAELTLGGRMDRVELGGSGLSAPLCETPHPARSVKLIDIKTASEIDGYDEFGKKVGWERSYRAQMCKDVGLGLYDCYLRKIGLVPTAVVLEVITKPSERYGKKCRLVKMELPEVLAYRERFDMLLELTAREILHYVRHYREMQPWPMNVSACSGKFGNCSFYALCNLGLNPRTEKLYGKREEHLSIKERISGI